MPLRIKHLVCIALAALACSCIDEERRIEIIDELYTRYVLPERHMSDSVAATFFTPALMMSMHDPEADGVDVLGSLSSGFPDSPSTDSMVDSIVPMGKGWYEVQFTQQGREARKYVKFKSYKIDIISDRP